MGLFSRIGSAIKSATSRVTAPFRRERPARNSGPAAPRPNTPRNPAPQAPRQQPAPQAPAPNQPQASSQAQTQSQGQKEQEAKDAALRARMDERRQRMDEERRQRSEANRIRNQNMLADEDEDLSDEAVAGIMAADYAIAPAERGSQAWNAAQKYIDTEDGINLNARSFVVRSGRHKGQNHSRPGISKYDAIDNASGWFKKMDDTGELFAWNEEKIIRGRREIVEKKGVASVAYLAEDRNAYHSGAPSFYDLWDRLGSIVGADTEIMPYRGIW